MQKIPLTGKKGKGKYTLVSNRDYGHLSQYKWCLHPRGYVNGWYPDPITGLKKKTLMHRVIMGVVGNSKLAVDHINHNTLDNRRENLRVVTYQQNRTPFQKNSPQMVRGIHLHLPSGKWVAKYSPNGTNILLGPFDSEVDAAKGLAAYRVSVQDFPHKIDVALAKGVVVPKPIKVQDIPKTQKHKTAFEKSLSRQGELFVVHKKGAYLGKYNTLKEAEEVFETGINKYRLRKDLWLEACRQIKKIEKEIQSQLYKEERYRKSDHYGISYMYNDKKWKAWTKDIHGKQIVLGIFNTEEEAIKHRIEYMEKRKVEIAEKTKATLATKFKKECKVCGEEGLELNYLKVCSGCHVKTYTRKQLSPLELEVQALRKIKKNRKTRSLKLRRAWGERIKKT